MKRYSILLLLLLLFLSGTRAQTTLLYEGLFQQGASSDIVFEGEVDAKYTSQGLEISGAKGQVRLNRYYSLAARTARYVVRFSEDAVADFTCNTRDYIFRIDVSKKQVSIPNVTSAGQAIQGPWKAAPMLNSEDEYLVEMEHYYSTNRATLTNLYTGESVQIDVVTDGQGGSNGGAVNAGVQYGMIRDYYCVALSAGGKVTISQMSVVAGACNLTLLIYGDSITQPEDYYPAKDSDKTYTQLIMNHVHGPAISSGRGGGTINDVLERIQWELPFVKAKYVMVTIGTNGGNTFENLCQLVEYIQSQGSIAILNNIPCNELGTQIETNKVIEQVRQKYKLRGCKFDLATSVGHDGLEVDKTTMWFENLIDHPAIRRDVYHHPNVKGARQMYLRSLVDVPEIYDGTTLFQEAQEK